MSTSRHWSRYTFIAYLILLVWLPMPLATKPLWAVAFLNIGAGCLSLATLLGCWRTNHQLPPVFQLSRPALLAFALFCGWVLLQNLAGYSINPFRSQQQWLLSISYLQMFILTLLLVDTRERLRTLLLIIVGGGVFQALYGGLMTLSGVEKIWWIEKLDHRNVATGTFTNRNQLANYLVMCLSAGCGLLIAGQQGQQIRNWRQFLRMTIEWLLSGAGWLRLLLAAIVIGIVLTHSRMGNATLFISLTTTGLLWLLRARKSRKSAMILIGSLLLIDTLIVGTWFGLDRVVERLQSTRVDNTAHWISGNQAQETPSGTSQETDHQAINENKGSHAPDSTSNHDNEMRDSALPDLFRMTKAHYLTGIGLGNFSTGFTEYKTLKTDRFFNEAHFDWLQFIVETGLPGFCLLGFMVISCAIHGIKALLFCRSRLLQGTGFAVTMSLTAGLLHAWVEYNLQVPATALLFTVMLALGMIARSLPDQKNTNTVPVSQTNTGS